MDTAPDSLTLAITGHLPFIVLLATGLALPTSLGLLWLYRRAVLRSMQVGIAARTGGPTAATPSDPTGHEPRRDVDISPMSQASDGMLHPAAHALHVHVLRAARRTAVAYVIGGFCYAIVMATAFLMAGDLDVAPVRFLFLAWIFAWPGVLTTTMALGSARRAMLLGVAFYFLVFAALGAIGVARSPDLDWTQVALSWLLFNAPPTLLLLAFLNRRVRAVGPLVLTFMVLAVTGSTLAVSIAGSDEALLRHIVDVGSVLGLGGTGIFVSLHLVGFLILGVVGWFILGWVRTRYERKRISDQSLTFDTLWLLFAVTESLSLAFEGAVWSLAGVIAFAAYKGGSAIALSLLVGRPSSREENVGLLLLRVFALGKRSERMFDALGSHWRHVGSIQLIAGPDLLTKTIEPHEFLDFLSGRLARRFIDGPASLDRRLSEMDLGRDRDGRFRVNDFFCHDDTWRTVFSRLVNQSDTVLMDLRTFSPQNAGCTFEVEEVVNLVPLERVVFVVDDIASEQFLLQVVRQAFNSLRPSSPNGGVTGGHLRLVRYRGSLGELLGPLCLAARSSPVVPTRPLTFAPPSPATGRQ
jgi:hypothetical protein